MFRYSLFVFVVLSCVSAIAQSALSDEGEKSVTVYVGDHRGTKVLFLPPEIDFEIDGRYLYNVEMLKDVTRISFQGDSLEIYTSVQRSNPEKVTIEAFQVGPGFYMPPTWKLIKGWPPRKEK